MDIRITCCALAILSVATPTLAGEIKRWVDRDGGIHFGDTAPLGTNSTLNTLVIITTAPDSKNLDDILRPGERRMLKKYEQRGRHLAGEKRRSLKKARQMERKIAQMESKCHYHEQKKDELERKLRRGYKPSQKASIVRSIDRHGLLIRQYCNRQ